jgi:protein-tyrosine phosphatase
MENLVKEKGLDWTIDSAGTGDWHIGQGPDPRSTREAAKHGIDISKQVCRQFAPEDFEKYDLIVVMDQFNKRDVLAQAQAVADRKKVRLLLGNKDVPDPYHDDTQFAPVFALVEAGCKKLMMEILAK